MNITLLPQTHPHGGPAGASFETLLLARSLEALAAGQVKNRGMPGCLFIAQATALLTNARLRNIFFDVLEDIG